MFPTDRPRRLRHHPVLRDLVRETTLAVHDLILPMFVRPGRGIKKEIASMPGNFQLSVDRHVLAAAVRSGAQTIVTLNLRHFPDAALAPWDVVAQSPDLAPEVVVQKLKEQAERHGGIEWLLGIHSKVAPEFVALLRTNAGLWTGE